LPEKVRIVMSKQVRRNESIISQINIHLRQAVQVARDIRPGNIWNFKFHSSEMLECCRLTNALIEFEARMRTLSTPESPVDRGESAPVPATIAPADERTAVGRIVAHLQRAEREVDAPQRWQACDVPDEQMRELERLLRKFVDFRNRVA
jgi:hypothetical protein